MSRRLVNALDVVAQHTPGPWKARGSRNSNDFGIIAQDQVSDGGWAVVAECFSDIRKPGEDALHEAAANARLIAAAPELLKELIREYYALSDIFNNWPGRDTTDGQVRLCRLRDLIAKATSLDAEQVQNGEAMDFVEGS